MDFNGLNRCFFIGLIGPIGRQNLLARWLVGLLARRLVGLLTCRLACLRCGYSDMKESLKPRK